MKHFSPLQQSHPGYLFLVPNMGDDGEVGRYFLTPSTSKRANGDYFQGIPLNKSDTKDVPYPNYFDFTDIFNRVGYEGGVDFRFGKKPIAFLTRFFEISGINNIKDCVILDSFGGSGSTAHAVLNLNKQDGGNRKFILIEREDYAEQITAERVKRVINGYADVEGTGGQFNFYELGPTLFTDDGEINELIGIQKLRDYICYSEIRRRPDPVTSNDNAYFLAEEEECRYYFHYEQDIVTALDHAFLASIKQRAKTYVIYADKCLLNPDYMKTHRIIFKKIPRDISKF
jgi:adenine-specific DNA-methyltransferase